MRNNMRTNRVRRSGAVGRSLVVKIGAVLLALCMVAVLALPAFAAEGSASVDDGYTYTVRIFPGDKGTIDGSENPFIRKEVPPGYEWSRSDFDVQTQAKSKLEKYRVTGMRESGKDNNTNKSYSGGGFTVDKDIDLVVSYGMKGSEVAYSIEYLEYGTESKLTVEGHKNPETFYGNVGEKPVVSYLHVDGYTPQYRNLTKTLSDNAADNVFKFYYVKNQTSGGGGGSGEGEALETEGESSEIEGGGETTTGGETATGTETTTTTTGGNTTTTTGGTTTTRTVTTTPATTTRTTTTTTGGTTTGGTTTGGTGTAGTGTAGTGTAGTGTAGTAAGGTGTAGTAAGGTGTGTAGTGTGTAGTGTGTNAGGTTAANNDNGTGTQVANAGNGTVNTQQNGPQEIVDLDEQQTPLAEYNCNSTGTASGDTNTTESSSTEPETPAVNSETEGVVRAQGMSTPAKVLLALAIILALGGAGWFFFRRFAMDADDEDEDEDDDSSDEVL